MGVLRAIIVKTTYLAALLCAIGGMVVMFGGVSSGEANAIQQAGIIAFGIGLAVVPYCIARAVERIF